MKVHRQCILETSIENAWERLLTIEHLVEISEPVLKLRLDSSSSIWVEGEHYAIVVKMWGKIPLGVQQVHIKKIDSVNFTIETEERGDLTKRWNHQMKLEKISSSSCRYTDRIDLSEGILTAPLWVFASYLYGHRQRKWARLVSASSSH